MKPWLKNRNDKSVCNNIFSELLLTDKEEFRRYLRMNTTSYEVSNITKFPAVYMTFMLLVCFKQILCGILFNDSFIIFQELLEKVRPYITKKTTHLREPITAEEKLAVTLRYLATGESFNSLMYQYRIHRSTISQFIPDVCKAIYKVLAPDYMKIPSDKEEWQKIINQTNSRWQFPNCYAAADGKHVGIICPPHSGSEFYNYKGFYSIVLLAIVDYDYKFLVAEVGCQGRISDGGVYRNSSFYSALKENKLNLPDPQPLPQSSDPYWEFHQDNDEIPIVFVGDDAFPLSEHCMKPYGLKNASDMERVFDYRLPRFR